MQQMERDGTEGMNGGELKRKLESKVRVKQLGMWEKAD